MLGKNINLEMNMEVYGSIKPYCHLDIIYTIYEMLNKSTEGLDLRIMPDFQCYSAVRKAILNS